MWTDSEMNQKHSLSIAEMLLYNVIENAHEILLTVLLQMQEIHVTCTHGQVNDQRGMQNVTGTVPFLVVATVHQYNELHHNKHSGLSIREESQQLQRSRLAQAVTLAARS